MPGAAEPNTGLLSSTGAPVRRIVIGALALVFLAGPHAHALDPRSALTEYSLVNWAENEGPFPFGVYAMAQDHDGYLWLGTRTGLLRFDGTNFTVWQGSGSLPDDRISVLRASRDGSLWLGFGTLGGVTRIWRGVVTTFGERDGLAGGDVNALFEDHDGSMWVGTFGGLSRFHDERWERFGADSGLPAESVLSLHVDRGGNLWVGTGAGVYRRRQSGHRFELASTLAVTDFAEDSSGVLWIADPRKGFRTLEPANATVWPISPLEDTPGRALLYDRSGTLWVGTRSAGLFRIRPPVAGEPPALEKFTRSDGLLSDEIRTLFEDRDGTLWVGTRMGLSRLSDSSVRAAAVAPGNDAYVYAVAQTSDGSVWTATALGLWRQRAGERQRFSVDHGLPSQIVTALHEDRSGMFWVATMQGIARSAAGRFRAIDFPRDAQLGNIRSITADWHGSLWICDSIRGLFRWNAGTLTRMNDGIHQGYPYVAYTDRIGRIWVGFWGGGLDVYHDKGVTRYAASDGLPTGTVNVIHEDLRGAIWVGTSVGLARLDNGRFTTYAPFGFPRSTVVSIVEDGQGYLWFGLGIGLLRINPAEFTRVSHDPAATLRYRLYASEDGLPGSLGRPGTPSATRGGDGRLWFLTSVGLAVVDPERLRERPSAGRVRVETVLVDGRRIEPAPGLQFPPGTSRIEINYSILNLAAAPRLRSRFRLEGFDSDWQDAEDRRQASYTNLSPGSYRFEVVSSNNEGEWNESGAVFDFAIEPAFHQTTPFYVAASLALVATVWFMWQSRLRRVRRQFDLVLAERARVGREIHDTLLQSLVGVALEFDDISSQLSPSEPLQKQVGRIREQVEHYIREARQSIWDLRSPTLDQIDLAGALRDFGNAVTLGRDVRFEFTLKGKPGRLAPAVEEQLMRIGQETLTNAVRHSGAHLTQMELSYDSSSLRLRVSDDGCGFDPEQIVQAPGVHWGMTTMRERAAQIGARFILTSRPGVGTTIEVIASRAAS
jgi:ligand-binding sensor domain-containing protein/signal transduction histidine kinase